MYGKGSSVSVRANANRVFEALTLGGGGESVRARGGEGVEERE